MVESFICFSATEWDKIFFDTMTTVAAIDRIVHHSTIIECQGESFRKKQSINKIKQGENMKNNM